MATFIASLGKANRRLSSRAASRARVVCSASLETEKGLILRGKSLQVDGEPALGSRVSGPILNRYIRDDGEEWMIHWTFRPDSGFDEKVVPGATTGYVGAGFSSDGIAWDVGKPALKPNTEDWWYFDTVHCCVGDVQLLSSDVIRSDGSVYFMYFHGGDDEIVTVGSDEVKGYRTRIGVAVSLDGRHWSRIEGEHANGSILDVGEDGCFDAEFVASPQVIKLGSEYRMYYHSYDRHSGLYGVGLAVSSTGLEFKRVQKDPIQFNGEDNAFFAKGVSSRHVIQKRDGTFEMFFEGVSESEEHSICRAVSADGISWDVPLSSPILTKGEASDWDGGGVGKPRVVVMDDQSIRLYYTGWDSESSSTAIGLAVSDGTDWDNLVRFS
mmetsp:Transcript_22109/g.89594  ORF Transcript_22109/g.89594 Transcript_22109/m.89594 type:complete len:382 (-) Transcript_22109:256-1401(-)